MTLLKVFGQQTSSKTKGKKGKQCTAEASNNSSKLFPRTPSKFPCNQPRLLFQKLLEKFWFKLRKQN